MYVKCTRSSPPLVFMFFLHFKIIMSNELIVKNLFNLGCTVKPEFIGTPWTTKHFLFFVQSAYTYKTIGFQIRCTTFE